MHRLQASPQPVGSVMQALHVSLIDPPAGCRFRPRCPHAFDRCAAEPALEARVGEGRHLDRCWLDPDTKRAVRDRTIHGEIAAA